MIPWTFADVGVGQVFVFNEGGYPRIKLEGPKHLVLAGYRWTYDGNPTADTAVYAVYKTDSLNLVEIK